MATPPSNDSTAMATNGKETAPENAVESRPRVLLPFPFPDRPPYPYYPPPYWQDPYMHRGNPPLQPPYPSFYPCLPPAGRKDAQDSSYRTTTGLQESTSQYLPGYNSQDLQETAPGNKTNICSKLPLLSIGIFCRTPLNFPNRMAIFRSGLVSCIGVFPRPGATQRCLHSQWISGSCGR